MGMLVGYWCWAEASNQGIYFPSSSPDGCWGWLLSGSPHHIAFPLGSHNGSLIWLLRPRESNRSQQVLALGYCTIAYFFLHIFPLLFLKFPLFNYHEFDEILLAHLQDPSVPPRTLIYSGVVHKAAF